MSGSRREIPIHVVGAIALALQGVYISSFGPLYPQLLSHFHLPQAEVGWIASANFLGATTAVLSATWLIGRLGARRILMIGPLLLGLGAIGVGVAPTWGLALACALVAGLGAGSVTSGINISLASLPGGSAPILNAVNAMFGLGCVLGPLLVALLPGSAVRWPFVIVGGLAFLVLACARMLPRVTPAQAPRDTAVGAKRGLTLFTALLFLYVMTEVGAGSWMTTHLAPQLGTKTAAAMVSGFWLAFMLGRFAGAPLAIRFPARVLVPVAAVLAILAAGLANIPEVRVPGYVLLGLVLGPIFPTTLAWYGQRLTPRLLPIAMTGGSLGAVAVQPLMGAVVSSSGVPAIPVTLMALACGLLALAVWVRWFQGTAEAREADTATTT